MTATALAVAHARGLLDYDPPVVAYWPEFAEAGKAAITVRQVLAHQVGLAAIDQRLWLVDLADQDRLAALIARQRPQWPPGTRQGYHYLTSGWIAAELIAGAPIPQGAPSGASSPRRSPPRLVWTSTSGCHPMCLMSGSPASRPSTGCGCCCIPGPCRQGCCWPSPLPGRSPPAPSSTRGWPAPGPSTARAAPHPDPGRQRDRHRTRRRPLLRRASHRRQDPGTHRPHPERANHPGDTASRRLGRPGLAHRHPILRRLPQALPRLPLRVQRPRVRRRRRRRRIRLRRPRPRLRLRAQPDGLPPVRRSPRAVPPHRRLPLPWCPAAHAPRNR
jgi:hypothetical protein